MYRLKFRKSAAGIGALIFGVVAMLVIPYIAATKDLLFDLPAAPFAAAQFIIPLMFALVTYRTCPFVQQLRAFLVTSSFIGFLGLLANSFGVPQCFAVIQQDWLLHFNAVSLGVMNLASLIAATNLMQAEQMSSFADTKVAEAQLERLKAVKVDPDTQAKWEKAAAYADRSADGRSLRSTMTNLKAISLTEPGQELKPTPRESVELPSRDKAPAAPAPSADDGTLANMLDRLDDSSLDASLSATKNSALSGNSFINEVADSEPADTGAGFLNSILNAKIEEEEEAVSPALGDLGLPAEEAETTDVAALLNSFADEPAESESLETESAAALFAAESQEEVTALVEEPIGSLEPGLDLMSKLGGDDDESDMSPAAAEPTFAAPDEKPETTRTSSFASASASRNSMPAMQPLNEGAAAEVTALSGDDTSNFPVPSAPAGLTPGAPTLTPSNTNNKLAAMKRRNTSTFTKLNALSASGSTLKPQQKEVESEPDSLRSLLDRLDDEPAQEEVKKVEETAKPIEPPVELTLDTVFKGDGAPEVAATPTTKAQPPAKVEAKAAPEPPAAKVEPEAKVEAAPEPEPEVAEKVEEKPAAPEHKFEGPDLSIGLDTEAAPLASLLDRSFGVEEEAEEAPAEATVEEPSEPLFGGGVDGEIDDIFSELAPPEAQKEVKDVLPSSAARGAAINAAPAEEDEAEPAEEAQGSLFGSGLESEIDDIFSELAPPEAQKEVKDVLPAAKAEKAPVAEAKAEAEPEPAAEAEAEPSGEGGLFGESLGEELDNIFSGLTESAQLEVNSSTLAKVKEEGSAVEAKAEPAKAEPAKAEPVAEKTPAAAASTEAAPAKPEPAKYKEVKEFGRLSSKPGSGAKFSSETAGTMKTIGKLLLDVQAVENIIKSGETKKLGAGMSTAKIISAARGEGIKNILNAIDTYEGVAGSLIVGHDGLVIASTVGTGWDKDMLGALSTALLSTSNLATKKLEIGKLRQMVMLTEVTNGDGQRFKTTVLTDVDVGILAVFLEKTDLNKIDGLLETIQSTIHGG
ncbi:MAG: roadblock/LC7 domain-containing protein [Cyanobacteria bacterium SZAS LIN-2]|nr:roadblock/LC7 domain-containing protein [Cyanobacteria bacterium SZAS LIN-2]